MYNNRILLNGQDEIKLVMAFIETSNLTMKCFVVANNEFCSYLFCNVRSPLTVTNAIVTTFMSTGDLKPCVQYSVRATKFIFPVDLPVKIPVISMVSCTNIVHISRSYCSID